MPAKHSLDLPYIRREQRRHFWLYDVVPAAISVVSIPLLLRLQLTAADAWIFLGMWFFTGIGVEVGYHRYFSHRAFKAKPWVEVMLIILASFSGQGPVIAWASNHRHHHRFSDATEDTHSPVTRSAGRSTAMRRFFHSHLFWKYEYAYPNPSIYVRDWAQNSRIKVWSARYPYLVLVGLAVPALLGAIASGTWTGILRGFLLGGVVRLTLSQHLTWSINSICHLVGSRRYHTTDQSRNVAWLAIPTLGGSWHNNHHAYPQSATNAHRFFELDLSYLFIRGLQILKQVSDVKTERRVDL